MARIATIDKKGNLPPVAKRTAHLGTYLRFESQLDPKIIELVALAVALPSSEGTF